ncbi:SDR family oxidoreductase [Streptomyces sp. BR123]|uniref:SDR family oxidoreductase n=1 Tax=Streptomyces sp. BR123 TaxID=2749828 RepID=UPI0028117CE4|nr:SDR family oxidoreductase [Streptomyces sp. BR123]
MLKGRNAAVTGGSRGIGPPVVERLCRDGAHVVFDHSTREDAAAEVVRTVEADGGRARALRVDLSEPEGPEQLVEAADACAAPPSTPSPGAMDTEMLRGTNPPQALDAVAGMAPLGRLGRPADLADVIAFLIGPDGRWITGRNLRATDGLA